MTRCVRLWTGEDQNSHFEEGLFESRLDTVRDLTWVVYPQ
jgi:hypothetical protein